MRGILSEIRLLRCGGGAARDEKMVRCLALEID